MSPGVPYFVVYSFCLTRDEFSNVQFIEERKKPQMLPGNNWSITVQIFQFLFLQYLY